MTDPNTDPDALERLLWEEPPADCKNTCEWMNGHAMRCHAVIRALAAEKRRARAGVTEDENGLPIGYADWYNSYFRGQPVDTGRDNSHEAAWRAALEAVLPDGRDAKDWYAHTRTSDRFTIEIIGGRLVQDDDGPWVLRNVVNTAIDAAMKDTDHD